MARRRVYSLSILLKYGDIVTTRRSQRHHCRTDMERLSVLFMDRDLILGMCGLLGPVVYLTRLTAPA
jgi:hypothetical protein